MFIHPPSEIGTRYIYLYIYSFGFPPLKQAQDVNVIIVDWQVGANRVNYALSATNTQVVGACSNFVKDRLGGSDFHCSGHSLGGQTCGYMGKAAGGNLDRITGQI